LILSQSVCLASTSCSSHVAMFIFRKSYVRSSTTTVVHFLPSRCDKYRARDLDTDDALTHTLQTSRSAQRPSSAHGMLCYQDHSLPY
jgi:hypothetical protein